MSKNPRPACRVDELTDFIVVLAADCEPDGLLGEERAHAIDERLNAAFAEVRAAALAEADLLPKADVVAWLTKKAREDTPVWQLASKVERGAVRPDNLRMLPPDFFEPGRTYAREHHASTIRFLVEHVSASPDGTDRVAFGWKTEDGDVRWSPFDSDDMGGWTEVTEGGAA